MIHILETIKFIIFRDDSFTRGQSNMRIFAYVFIRIASVHLDSFLAAPKIMAQTILEFVLLLSHLSGDLNDRITHL